MIHNREMSQDDRVAELFRVTPHTLLRPKNIRGFHAVSCLTDRFSRERERGKKENTKRGIKLRSLFKTRLSSFSSYAEFLILSCTLSLQF
jgi:hypothetical protein